MKIIVSGSTAFDRIMDFPGTFAAAILPQEIHKLNVSFVVKEFRETFGGAGANIAYNLALLKERPVLCTAVGKDFNPYLKKLKQFKVDIAGVKIYPQDLTASAYIITDRHDNQITGFFPGAMKFFGQKVKTTKGDLAIIAPGNANEMLDLAERYFCQGTFFIFDPGQQIGQFTPRQLKRVLEQADLYIVNDYELAVTKKITGYSADQLIKSAGILINTLGNQGSIINLYQQGKYVKVKVPAVKTKMVKDPTGAGDAYRAGLIKGLRQFKRRRHDNYLTLPWLKIGQQASLAAVYAVEEYGTQNHFYSYRQFKKRFFKEFKVNL